MLIAAMHTPYRHEHHVSAVQGRLDSLPALSGSFLQSQIA